MSTPVTWQGVLYNVPAFGDVGYAQGPGNLSSYLIALANGVQTTGGLFSLTAPLNFGPNFGILATSFSSTSANPATAGQIRLANTDTIDWRNFANTGNLPLAVNTSNQLTFNGAIIDTAAAGGTVTPGTAGNLTLYPATGNTVSDTYVQNAFNINLSIAAQAARSTALVYTVPNPGNAVATATFALLELAQTFTATQTFVAATFTGLITGVNETLSGVLTLSALTNQLVFGTTNTITITAPAPAASRVYTIPDVLGAASFVMTAGIQSIAGVKTFTGGAGAITLSASTIAMGGGAITGSGNITFSPTTAGIVGTTTNDNAVAGNVGEYVSANATGVALSTVAANITSISLTAGDWDVFGMGTWDGSATAGYVRVGLSTTSATFIGAEGLDYAFTTVAVAGTGSVSLMKRFSLSGTTTIFLVAALQASSGSGGNGNIQARRRR